MNHIVWIGLPNADRLIAGPFGMVYTHWYRSTAPSLKPTDPCAFQGCDQPAQRHFRWCDEWRMPRRMRWRTMARRIVHRRQAA